MPKLEWLKTQFDYGYDSGNILSIIPNKQRRHEERMIGGSYRNVFLKGARPYIQGDSRVLELGPGRGSWTKAFLKYLTNGEVHTVDFQDVTKWLHPEQYQGRLRCFQITDFDYSILPDDYYDFFWSIGVLCHNNAEDIKKVLESIYPKMKKGAFAVHHYGNWDKLERFVWSQGKRIPPPEFKNLPDSEIWWPRNNDRKMAELSSSAGWNVINSDMEFFKRDSVILLQK